MTQRFDAFSALATTESLTDAHIEEWAQALLDQLTLDEKIGLMDGDQPFWQGLAELADMTKHGDKHLSVAGAVPRLSIPGVRFSDGPRGVVLSGATTFPVSMAHGSKVERAPKELKAFARVALAPGETCTVSLAVPVSDLASYDATRGWSIEPIAYEVIIARHSLDPQAGRAQFTIIA